MTGWINLLASGDWSTLITGLIIVFATGGLGSTLVNTIAANKRGIRGNAIDQENAGIEGLSKLTHAQGVVIERLDNQLITATKRIQALEQCLRKETEHSNANIALMMNNGMTPIPRKE